MFNFDTEVNDGYTFDGWYKERECINKWDFTVDILTMKISDDDMEFNLNGTFPFVNS